MLIKDIGKTFAGDAPLFLLGVLAMGVTVIDVGLYKRLATWILGWTKGFALPIIVWKKILDGISWDAWFMYCSALTLGALLKES